MYYVSTHLISKKHVLWNDCIQHIEFLMVRGYAVPFFIFLMTKNTSNNGILFVFCFLLTLCMKANNFMKKNITKCGETQYCMECCCCSITQLFQTLSDPMDCSTPKFPSFTVSWSLLKLVSIELVMPSNNSSSVTSFSSFLQSFPA